MNSRLNQILEEIRELEKSIQSEMNKRTNSGTEYISPAFCRDDELTLLT
ncbi:MAG: hypothetical protein M0Z60_06075 [Nitrospiraceae bacterium]|nr:hypothetical protein [Nitrospiraceae bacterium]